MIKPDVSLLFRIEASNDSERSNSRDFLVKLANCLIVLYLASVYVWSSNETMYVYSNLLCLLTLAMMLLVVTIRRLIITLPFAFLLSFGDFCIASIMWAEDPSRSTTMAFKTLPLLIVFALVLHNYICFTKQKVFLLNSIYFAGIVLALYTVIVQGGLAGFLGSLGGGVRIGGEVANENTVGMGTAFSLLIAFYYLIYEKRVLHLFPLALNGLVALATGSNKALIIIVFGCVALLVFRAYINGSVLSLCKYTALIVCLIIAVLYLLQLPAFETINTRFTSMVDTLLGVSSANASTAERMNLTEAGLMQFVETPLLGIGIANSGIITQQAVIGFDSYLHNNYVELLACVGVVGTFLFYLGPCVAVWRLARNLTMSGNESAVVLVIISAWFLIQVGWVSYADKVSYIFLTLLMVYSYPTGEERGDNVEKTV